MQQDNPCGCFGDPNNPSGPSIPPEGAVYVAGSVNCPTPPSPCHTPLCDERFRSLPPLARIEVVGANGKCLYKLEHGPQGLIMVDPRGGFIASASPVLDLPQLVSYVDGANGLLLGRDRKPIEADPPEFPYLMVQLANGEWRKVRGKAGSVGLLVWDQSGFHMKDIDDVNVAISRPDETTASLELVGFDPDSCPENGERAKLVRFDSPDSGVVWFDAETGRISARDICDLFTSFEDLTSVPFLLACSGAGPVKFRGGDVSSVLAWNPETEAFEVVTVDQDKCLDAACCGCSSELYLIWNCETRTFTITEPNSHVLMWRSNTDNGANVSITFTLPWPGLVTIHALRRLVPDPDSPDAHGADIIVDGISATSPSDGGMVGYLNSSSTSQGLAILPLPMGGHTAHIGNSYTTGSAEPQFGGAWMKIVAHKIAECEPVRPPVGGGSIIPTGSPGTARRVLWFRFESHNNHPGVYKHIIMSLNGEELNGYVLAPDAAWSNEYFGTLAEITTYDPDGNGPNAYPPPPLMLPSPPVNGLKFSPLIPKVGLNTFRLDVANQSTPGEDSAGYGFSIRIAIMNQSGTDLTFYREVFHDAFFMGDNPFAEFQFNLENSDLFE